MNLPKDKLDAIHDTVLGMKPIVEATAATVKGIELRQSFLETTVAKHDVRIEHVENKTGINKREKELNYKEDINLFIEGMRFIKENKIIFGFISFFGIGTCITIYNWIVSYLHRIPQIPVSNIPHG